MALPELLPQLGTEQIWDVLTEKMSVKAPSLVPCSPQSSKLNVNCASLLCARCLGDLRCKEWPLSSEGPWPRHHPPSGDTRVGGGVFGAAGHQQSGKEPSVICPGVRGLFCWEILWGGGTYTGCGLAPLKSHLAAISSLLGHTA